MGFVIGATIDMRGRRVRVTPLRSRHFVMHDYIVMKLSKCICGCSHYLDIWRVLSVCEQWLRRSNAFYLDINCNGVLPF